MDIIQGIWAIRMAGNLYFLPSIKIQKYLLDALNIERLFAVAGGSMGAMQVLQRILDYPKKILNAANDEFVTDIR